jgi:hypothetical protein
MRKEGRLGEREEVSSFKGKIEGRTLDESEGGPLLKLHRGLFSSATEQNSERGREHRKSATFPVPVPVPVSHLPRRSRPSFPRSALTHTRTPRNPHLVARDNFDLPVPSPSPNPSPSRAFAWLLVDAVEPWSCDYLIMPPSFLRTRPVQDRIITYLCIS